MVFGALGSCGCDFIVSWSTALHHNVTDVSPLCDYQVCLASVSIGCSHSYAFYHTAPEQPMKSVDMAALDVDSSQSDFLQLEEGKSNQVRFPSRDCDCHYTSSLRFQQLSASY